MPTFAHLCRASGLFCFVCKIGAPCDIFKVKLLFGAISGDFLFQITEENGLRSEREDCGKRRPERTADEKKRLAKEEYY